jgi:outer membrane protein assembly factor BamB
VKTLLRLSRLLTLACLIPAIQAETTDWPSWRGSAGTGSVAGAKPPVKWSDTENIRWKAPVPGLGFSTPIVWKDRVYVLTAVESGGGSAPAAVVEPPPPGPGGDARGKGKGGKRGGPPGGGFGGGSKPSSAHEFTVMALDRATGRTVWSQVARREVPHEGKHPTNSFASGSPVTDGERLYVTFGSRGYYCYDLDGKLLWEKDLGALRTRNSFGEGASPALAGDKLIITCDQEEGSFIVALDKRTGREVWRKSREERSSWSTPLVVESGGRTQAIVAAAGRTRSYDPATGELIWEAAGLTENVIPMPVTGHGLVYVMSGFRGFSIQAIRLDAKGDVTDSPAIAWNVRRSAPYVPSPVLSGDRLYMIKSNDAFLSCLNALTGEVIYQDQRLEGLRGLYASPLAAGGLVYLVGREGATMVIRDAAKFEIVSNNQLSDRFDASPVILGRELFLRGHQHLYCISEG